MSWLCLRLEIAAEFASLMSSQVYEREMRRGMLRERDKRRARDSARLRAARLDANSDSAEAVNRHAMRVLKNVTRTEAQKRRYLENRKRARAARRGDPAWKRTIERSAAARAEAKRRKAGDAGARSDGARRNRLLAD